MPWTAPANATTPGKRTAAGSKDSTLPALFEATNTTKSLRHRRPPHPEAPGTGVFLHQAFFSGFLHKPFLSLKPTQRCAQPPGTHPNEPAHDKHAQRPP